MADATSFLPTAATTRSKTVMNHAQLVRPRVAICIAAFVGLFLPGIGAAAGEWTPDRPMRMLVQYPPGGTSDLLARVIATPLASAVGQQVVVDNRPGANGVIAMDIVARAQPNGYTFGIVSISAHAGN